MVGSKDTGVEMLEDKSEELKEVLVFLTKLTLLSFLMYIISSSFDFYAFQEFTADVIYEVISTIGMAVEKEGIRLGVGGFDFLITEDSTAWKGMFFFFSLLIASGSTLKKTVLGIVVGIPVIYALNLFRILTLILFTTQVGPSAYEIIHSFLWHSTMIIAVLVLWIMWIRKAEYDTNWIKRS